MRGSVGRGSLTRQRGKVDAGELPQGAVPCCPEDGLREDDPRRQPPDGLVLVPEAGLEDRRGWQARERGEEELDIVVQRARAGADALGDLPQAERGEERRGSRPGAAEAARDGKGRRVDEAPQPCIGGGKERWALLSPFIAAVRARLAEGERAEHRLRVDPRSPECASARRLASERTVVLPVVHLAAGAALQLAAEVVDLGLLFPAGH